MNIELYIPTKPNSLIKKIWGVSANSLVHYQMLPEASANLVFNLGSSFSVLQGSVLQNSAQTSQKFCFLSGLHAKPVVSLSSPCSYEMVVELHPLAVNALFGIPASELENNVISGDMILDDLNYVEDKLLTESSFTAKAKWLERYLYSKLKQSHELSVAAKMNAAINNMHANLLVGKKVDLQEYTGYSRMHTHRLTTQWLGLSPVKYLRLQQFIKALQELHSTQRSASYIASSNGFFDQSHFNRIFRQFTEMTPKQYRKIQSDMVGQLYSNECL